MFREGHQDAAVVRGGQRFGVVQQRPADPAAGVVVQDVHVEERAAEVFLQLAADPGPCDHPAVHPDEEEPHAGVGVVLPVPEPGAGRCGPVEVAPALQHQGVAEPAEVQEVTGVRRTSMDVRQDQGFDEVRRCSHRDSLTGAPNAEKTAPRKRDGLFAACYGKPGEA